MSDAFGNLTASPLSNPYYSRARRELDLYLREIRRDCPRYEMPVDEAHRFLRAEEHSMRMEDYQAAIAPLVKAMVRLEALGVLSITVTRNADGSLGSVLRKYSPQVQRQLDQLHLLIKNEAGRFGLATLSAEEKSRLEALMATPFEQQTSNFAPR